MQNKSGAFETALARLEAIVKTLETQDVGLDASVELFKEGKQLAAQCETLLKSAQTAIEAASVDVPKVKPAAENAPARLDFEDDIPF